MGQFMAKILPHYQMLYIKICNLAEELMNFPK